jgi:hypothetical protein
MSSARTENNQRRRDEERRHQRDRQPQLGHERRRCLQVRLHVVVVRNVHNARQDAGEDEPEERQPRLPQPEVVDPDVHQGKHFKLHCKPRQTALAGRRAGQLTVEYRVC